jgi:hypothetical protein
MEEISFLTQALFTKQLVIEYYEQNESIPKTNLRNQKLSSFEKFFIQRYDRRNSMYLV